MSARMRQFLKRPVGLALSALVVGLVAWRVASLDRPGVLPLVGPARGARGITWVEGSYILAPEDPRQVLFEGEGRLVSGWDFALAPSRVVEVTPRSRKYWVGGFR